MSAYYIRFVTLYIKELRRFTKIPGQTILAPAATTLLFMVIFSTAIGSSRNEYILTDFKSFLFPGLIMMTMLQNSFANAASSIGQSKFQGNIVDILMAPLSDLELASGYILGAIARGLICGLVTFIGILFFIPLTIFIFVWFSRRSFTR